MAGFGPRLGFCSECRTPDVMTVPSRWSGEDVCRDCDDGDDVVLPSTTRRYSLDPGACTTCDADRTNRGPKPPHDASTRCKSGGRSHCTCGVCFG